MSWSDYGTVKGKLAFFCSIPVNVGPALRLEPGVAALAYGAPHPATRREVGPFDSYPMESSPAENLEQANVEC